MIRIRESWSALLVMAAFAFLLCTPAQAQWYADWAYRTPVTVANPCGSALVDQPVLITLDSAFDFTKAESDGSDLRVTADDGVTLLDFWIETWDAVGENAGVRVTLPTLSIGGETVYLYYGKTGTAALSDGAPVFTVYDGFEDDVVGGAPTAGSGNPGEWARYAGNPLITEGTSGQWDDHGATFGSVIWDDTAGEFRMYYHGFSFTGVHQIGLATSPDALNWTKYGGNPVMTPGPAAWDGQSVRVPMVWKEGPTDYRMIYTGNGSGGMQVGYATSTDGISWTKSASNPVFNDPTWASGATENWGVMKVGSEYLMWYSNFGMRQSGIAVSTDLVNWTPHTPGPIFSSSGIGSDDRYSQYCPSSFTYGGYYYVLVPSYSSGSNYSKFYLYRSSSPYFPEADRHLVRVAHTVGADGQWDDHDSDTPCVLTLDIERSQFYNDELWLFYAGEGGSDLWKEGLHLETDIAAALADAELPGGNLSWGTSGDVTVVDGPVRQGMRAVCLNDTSASSATSLTAQFGAQVSGRVSAWMRRSATTVGDFDIYLYGGATLSCVAGLGRNGDFHYWNGAFQPTGVNWSIDTWYLVSLAFDADTDLYNFTVHDQTLTELVNVPGIAFGNGSTSISSAVFYTSSGFLELGYVDDVRVEPWCGADPAASPGVEETGPGTDVVSATLSCLPASGTVPFSSHFTVGLSNTYDMIPRTIAGRLDVTLASGAFYSNWRSGFTNVAPGASFISEWNTTFPMLFTVIGSNSFLLSAQDITAAPYNQPPYLPAGDTDTASCAVEGIAP